MTPRWAQALILAGYLALWAGAAYTGATLTWW
jgi:hypothetical protein